MVIDYLKMRDLYEKFRKDYLKYAREIKDKALEFFRDNFEMVVVFGSTVEGKSSPLSDIDIAVITKREVNEFDRAKFRVSINKIFGLHPFEIHIITISEWDSWYKRFVKKYIKV